MMVVRLRSKVTTGSVAVLIAVAWMSLPATASQITCPPSPPAVRDIDLGGYYVDKAKSVVDKAAEARKRATVKPLKDYLNQVAKFADRSVLAKPHGRREGLARCGLAWLAAWARDGAYLGRISSKQAEAQRKWDLTGLALAYLKLRPFASKSDRTSIEPWLHEIADRARAVYDDSGKIRNNHWYWLGLGLGAVGLATDSNRHWAEARRIMMDAARDIELNGLLSLELKRGKRALHYHTFSAMPLVTLAELAMAKRENWYALEDGALHQLVAATADGLIDPARFDAAAGVRQERPVKSRAGWLQLYQARFPDRLPSGVPRSNSKDRRLGGDVKALRTRIDEIRSLQ